MATVLTIWKRQRNPLPGILSDLPREPVAEVLVLPTFRGQLQVNRHNGIDVREQEMLTR